MNNFKKNIVNILIIITVFMSNITLVSADSGLESTYKEDGSIGAIIEAVLNLLSFLGKLITTQPSDKDYAACHAITAITCIIVFYIVTSINVFKLDKRKKNAKQNLKLLSISLIPTTIFSIFCFITKLQLILYIFITILYIIVLIIVFKYVVKNKIKKQLIEVKNIDNNFNEEEFSREAFEIYKKVQLSWSEFKLEEVKDII